MFELAMTTQNVRYPELKEPCTTNKRHRRRIALQTLLVSVHLAFRRTMVVCKALDDHLVLQAYAAGCMLLALRPNPHAMSKALAPDNAKHLASNLAIRR